MVCRGRFAWDVTGKAGVFGNVGDVVQYAFTVENVGSKPAHRVTVTDPGATVVEQNYEFDLVNADKLLQKYIDKPIAAFQGISFQLADMATQIEASRLMVYNAAYRASAGLSYSQASAMAKLMASETAMKVTTQAVQILGGYGYSREYPVERMMRDAKITEIYEGTSEIQRLVIGAALTR